MRHRMVGLVSGLSLLAAGALGAITVLPAPLARAAYPGRDGTIAYVIASPSGTSHDIWTVNPDGTGNRRITTDGKSWHPRWSPDGKLIAFERNKDIYVMTPTGAAWSAGSPPPGGRTSPAGRPTAAGSPLSTCSPTATATSSRSPRPRADHPGDPRRRHDLR